MTDPSFYYAIYKRLQATASSHGAHINGDNDPPDQTYGGFSLKYADATYGIFKQLGAAGDVLGLHAGHEAAQGQRHARRPTTRCGRS